jgi:hypothetical protein
VRAVVRDKRVNTVRQSTTVGDLLLVETSGSQAKIHTSKAKVLQALGRPSIREGLVRKRPLARVGVPPQNRQNLQILRGRVTREGSFCSSRHFLVVIVLVSHPFPSRTRS